MPKKDYRNLARMVLAGKFHSAIQISLFEGLKGVTESTKQSHSSDQAELALILGVSSMTIQRAIKAGNFPWRRDSMALMRS